MTFFIPLEIVREIIAFILDAPAKSSSPEDPGSSTKPDWELIHSFSMTGKAYRLLVLEAWFRYFFVDSPSDLCQLPIKIPEVRTHWIRKLHCIQQDLPLIQIWDLAGYTTITSIRLDWRPTTALPSQSPDYPFKNISSIVTEFDLRGLTWPSPMAFHFIGSAFPDLRVLKLRQWKIWCGLCHTCTFVRFSGPSPDKLVYEKGLGLPMHYACVLHSLKHLEVVQINIADCGSGETTLENAKADIWSGECDRCISVMYEDDDFKKRWVSRKKGQGKENEMVYTPPPALSRVEWIFWEADQGWNEFGDGDADSTSDEFNDSSDENLNY